MVIVIIIITIIIILLVVVIPAPRECYAPQTPSAEAVASTSTNFSSKDVKQNILSGRGSKVKIYDSVTKPMACKGLCCRRGPRMFVFTAAANAT